MKRIRKRPERPEETIHKRVVKRSYGVYMYLVILSIIPLWLCWVFFGEYLRFEARGEVVTETAAVETMIVARVSEVFVEPGDEVKKGDILFRVTSLDHLTNVAGLTAQLAGMRLGLITREERSATATAQKPIVINELKRLIGELKTLKESRAQGLIPQTRVEEIYQRIAELRQEREFLKNSVTSLEFGTANLDTLEGRISDINSAFSDGIIRARVDGTMGLEIAKPGEVVTVGEQLATIKMGRPYVTAYLPERYFCSIAPGMEVSASAGTASSTGVIDAILPLAGTFSEDNQANYSRLAKPERVAIILLDKPQEFSIGQQVSLTLDNQMLCLMPSLQTRTAGNIDELTTGSSRKMKHRIEETN